MKIEFYDGWSRVYTDVRKVKEVHERLGPACMQRDGLMINVGNRGKKILEGVPVRYVIDENGQIYEAYKHNGKYHEYRRVAYHYFDED